MTTSSSQGLPSFLRRRRTTRSRRKVFSLGAMFHSRAVISQRTQTQTIMKAKASLCLRRWVTQTYCQEQLRMPLQSLWKAAPQWVLPSQQTDSPTRRIMEVLSCWLQVVSRSRKNSFCRLWMAISSYLHRRLTRRRRHSYYSQIQPSHNSTWSTNDSRQMNKIQPPLESMWQKLYLGKTCYLKC